MNIRIRKLIGTVLLVLFVGIYALVVIALAGSRLLELGWVVSVLFYAAAGLLWVPPAALLIRWMERPTRQQRQAPVTAPSGRQ